MSILNMITIAVACLTPLYMLYKGAKSDKFDVDYVSDNFLLIYFGVVLFYIIIAAINRLMSESIGDDVANLIIICFNIALCVFTRLKLKSKNKSKTIKCKFVINTEHGEFYEYYDVLLNDSFNISISTYDAYRILYEFYKDVDFIDVSVYYYDKILNRTEKETLVKYSDVICANPYFPVVRAMCRENRERIFNNPCHSPENGCAECTAYGGDCDWRKEFVNKLLPEVRDNAIIDGILDPKFAVYNKHLFDKNLRNKEEK